MENKGYQLDTISLDHNENDVKEVSQFCDDKSTDNANSSESRSTKETKTHEVQTEVTPLRVPDGGWGWMVVLGAFISHTIGNGLEQSKGILYLELLSRFHKSSTETTWVLTLSSSLGFLGGPLLSGLCERISCRTTCVVGAVLVVTGILVSGFAENMAVLYFSYGILLGIGKALIYAACIVILGQYFNKALRTTVKPRKTEIKSIGKTLNYAACIVILGQYFNKRLGFAVGLTTAGNGIGSFAFPPLVECLFASYSVQGAFMVLAAMVSHQFVTAALFRPIISWTLLQIEQSAVTPFWNCIVDVLICITLAAMANHQCVTKALVRLLISERTCNKNASVCNVQHVTSQKVPYEQLNENNPNKFKRKKKIPRLSLHWNLLCNVAFAATCIQVLLHHMARQAILMFLPAFAISKGITASETAFLLSARGICEAVAKCLMTIILDKKQIKPYRLAVYSCVVILMGVLALTLPSSTSFVQFMIVSSVYGFLSGTRSQKTIVIVDTLGAEHLTGAAGWLLFFQGVGSIVGPTVAALCMDHSGSYNMAIYLGAVGHLSGGVLMVCATIYHRGTTLRGALARTLDAIANKRWVHRFSTLINDGGNV